MNRYLLAIILVVSFYCSLKADEPYATYVLGQHRVVSIPEKALRASPSWAENAENPPLSARKAIKLAKVVSGSKELKLKLESVSLTPAGDEKWYWLITYTGTYLSPEGYFGNPVTIDRVVLMDGTVMQVKMPDQKER